MKKTAVLLALAASLTACGQPSKPAPQAAAQTQQAAATQAAQAQTTPNSVMATEATGQAIETVLKQQIAKDKVFVLGQRYSPNTLTYSCAAPSMTSVSFMTDATDRVIGMSISFLKNSPARPGDSAQMAKANEAAKNWLEALFISGVNPALMPALREVMTEAAQMDANAAPIVRSVGNIAVMAKASEKTQGMVTIGVMEAPKQ